MRRSLMIAIQRLLERLEADASVAVDEALVGVVPQPEVGLEHGADRIDDLALGERSADDVAEARVVARSAAEHELVRLRAGLVDPEDPDVAHVVVAARVDAARHLEADVAE